MKLGRMVSRGCALSVLSIVCLVGCAAEADDDEGADVSTGALSDECAPADAKCSDRRALDAACDRAAGYGPGADVHDRASVRHSPATFDGARKARICTWPTVGPTGLRVASKSIACCDAR